MKRYEFECVIQDEVVFKEVQTGQWVRYDDAAELEAENERLRSVLRSLERHRDAFVHKRVKAALEKAGNP